MEHQCSMGPHQYPFLKKCTILHCILNLSSPFSLRYFLTPNLSSETFGTFYIEIMIDKEIAKRLQHILL